MPTGVYKRKLSQRFHPLYNTWRGMHERCRRKRSISYNNYGGRGISICERWYKFQNFVDDMGEKPSKNHELDRINNDGNYCPENCRWATPLEQNRNSRHTKKVEWNGKIVCITELSEIVGLPPPTLYSRYQKGLRGTDLAKEPRHTLTLNGVKRTWCEWSKITGIPYNTILKRVKYKKPVHVVLENGIKRKEQSK